MRAVRPPLALLAAAVALATLALAAPGAPPPRAEASSGETITTRLHPGWNMVGWVGPATPMSELFEAIPALERLYAWDADEQRYRRAVRGRDGDLPMVAPGMGLWLWLGGDSTVEWVRPTYDEGVLLDLRSGRNLLGWTGEDGARVADALAPFGRDLVQVWRWDSKTQRYIPYPPGSGSFGLATLARGEALRIELARDKRWWKRGIAGPTFVFEDDITADQRREVQALFNAAIDVIAMRFGAHTTDFTVNVDVGNTFHCSVSHDVIEFQFPGCGASAVAHEYFHVLQNALAGESHVSYFGPDWMSEGTAEYAQNVYDRQVERQGRNPRFAVEQLVRTPGDVHDFDRRHPFLPYALGFIAAEWLANHAGEESLVEFYRLGRTHDRWEDAFRLSFRVDMSDFYGAVEMYRHERAPLYPHLLDDQREVIVVPLSQAATPVATGISAGIANLTDFLSERFGADRLDYTVYVVDEEAYPYTFAGAFGHQAYCTSTQAGSVIVIFDCEVPESYHYHSPDGDHYTQYINDHHVTSILHDLAPAQSTSHLSHGEVYCPWGIFWLCIGVPAYANAMYEDHTATEPLNRTLTKQIAVSQGVGRPLSRFEANFTTKAGYALNAEAETALFFLAAHRLAAHAGERALLEYFRVLPSAQTIDEAFEHAFGLTIDDFYDQFEAYRATLR